MLKHLLASAALLALLPAHADISISSGSFTYSENFDSLTTSTTAVAWANDSTLPGFSLLASTGTAVPTIAADTGASNAGTFRSFGASGSSERALGGVASGGAYFGSPPSGQVAGWIVVAFRNDSGGALDGFTLAFAGEQWRNGGNASPQTMVLEYGFGSSYAAVTSWSVPGGGFDFTSPVVGTTAAAVDGNGAGRVAGLGGSVTGAAWAAGNSLFIRWVERNDVGNDHGLAIDDLSFSVIASAVPEPGAWALLLAGAGVLAFVARRARR